MASSVAIFDKTMNITERVLRHTPFMCDCGWFGVATELANLKGFSCCPKCNNFDVRINFEMISQQKHKEKTTCM